MVRGRQFVLVSVICMVSLLPNLQADERPEKSNGKTAQEQATPTPADELALKQSRIADKYTWLENLMLKVADQEDSTNPRRAALLKRAVGQSKEEYIQLQLERIVKLLNQQKLKRALDNQKEVRADLKALLDLLQNENRQTRLKNEQARVRDYIKQVQRLINKQRSLQGRTEGGEGAKRLANDQGDVARQSGDLAKRIQQNEENEPTEEKDQQQGKGNRKGDEKGDGKQQGKGKGESKDGKGDGKAQGKGQGKEKGNSQGNGDANGDGKGQGQGGQKGGEGQGAQSAQQGQQQNGFPARNRIQAATERMRKAQEQLEKAKRGDAIKDQQQARRLLEQAKTELEEILRQLREEEIERMLAMLESRFRKMLQMQLKVYDGTKKLAEDASQSQDPAVETLAGKLSLAERRIVIEADKALALLREEGSSVAFPEAIDQMRGDMQQIVDRLARIKVGPITQGIEEDIIEALEEMIEALQKAQKEMEERRQQQQQQANGASRDQPLVDAISELKMIRALQMRVNKRTRRYSRLLDDIDDPIGQATGEELIEALEKLAQRQDKIHRVTRDIVVGKNR